MQVSTHALTRVRLGLASDPVSLPDRPKHGLMSFDLARSSGWAYCFPGGEHTCGEFLLPPVEPWGAMLSAANERIWELVEHFEPKSCTIEAAIHVHTDTEANFRTAWGLSAVATEVLYRAQVIHRHATPKTIRSTVLRDGNIPGKSVKSIVIQFCRDRGWSVPGNDAADATIALLYEAKMMRVAGPHCPRGEWDQRRWWRGEML